MKQSSNPGHFKKGIPSWNKGLKRWWNSPTEFKKGIVSTNKGKQLSKGVRERISNSMKGKHNMEYYKEMGIRGLLKQQNSKEPTSIEKKVYEELKNCGLLFEKQHLVNGKFLVDAYIPSLNLIIEADGDYWHSLDRVVKKDKAENAYLTKCGFNLLRFTETEINNGSFKERMVN